MTRLMDHPFIDLTIWHNTYLESYVIATFSSFFSPAILGSRHFSGILVDIMYKYIIQATRSVIGA